MTDLFSELVDERDIVALALRYTTAVDENNPRGFAECFTEDGRSHSEFFDARGREEIGSLVTNLWTLVGKLQHVNTNFVVQLDGDSARLRSCVVGTHVARDDPQRLFVIGGVYFDELRRTENGWKIAERFVRVDWTTGDPAVVGP